MPWHKGWMHTTRSPPLSPLNAHTHTHTPAHHRDVLTIIASCSRWTPLPPTQDLTQEASLEDRGLDAVLRKLSGADFSAKVIPSSFASKQVGNCYTGAVFMNLLSLISDVEPATLLGKRVGMFSYGSGSVASMYR